MYIFHKYLDNLSQTRIEWKQIDVVGSCVQRSIIEILFHVDKKKSYFQIHSVPIYIVDYFLVSQLLFRHVLDFEKYTE